MSLRELLEEKLGRFEQLEKQLLDPAVQSNSSQMAAVAREHGSLAKLATKYRRFKQLNQEDRRSHRNGRRRAMPKCASWPRPNCPSCSAAREQLWNELLDMTVGGEDANRLRCVMEIRAGTGGEEAALFARDLYEMYRHYAEEQGLEGGSAGHERHRTGRIQGGDPGHRGRRRLSRAAIRKRRPPRAARARNRGQGPHPHLRRHRGRAGRARGRRNRSEARRLSQGHVFRQRARRAARQQDGQSPSG